MKKGLIRFMIFVLLFGVFSYAVFHDENRINHVHVLEAAGFGNCPECGRPLVGGEIPGYEATCTESGWAEVWCDNPSCPNYEITEGMATPPLGHSYQSKVTKEATCSEAGTRRYTCIRCSSSYNESIPALGHNYQETIVAQPTCTDPGTASYKCSRNGCNSSYTSQIAALGHSYKITESKEATCEEEGYTKYTCSRCKNTYEKHTAALGHDIDYEEKEATCTEDGFKNGTCKRCHEEFNETIPALGHDLEYVITKMPTCTEEGQREATCQRCGEKTLEKILPSGHKYPHEWTVEKEPSYLEEGLQSKTCFYCGNRITQLIPRKNATAIIGGATGAAVILGGLLWYLKRSGKLFRKAAEETKKFIKPDFETKTIVVCSKDEELLDTLKSKSYLAVKTCEYEELEKSVEDNEPDLILTDVPDEDVLKDLNEKKKEDGAFAEQTLAYLCGKEFVQKHKKKLNGLVKDKKILGYAQIGDNPDVTLVKLILPILKPDLKSDTSLGNIGKITDALGIPGISTIIDVYVAGRDIKATLEEEELGVSETATIIADVASILGMDTVASVAGLVDDVNSVKAALDKEAGAHEHKSGYSGAKDIVEVVSDLADKK